VDQLIALRLHVLYLVVVLGEGTKFGLEHGGVLPGLIELFLKRLCPEHCIAIPQEHIGFLSGSLHDILQKAIIITRALKYGRIRLLKGPVT
jgi:hypothetical protein